MKKFLTLVFIFCFSSSYTQSFQPAVIGSAGADASFTNGFMAWTIGETMTETFSASPGYFTQGFHQPDSVLIISVADFDSLFFSIYPNPVVCDLFLDFGNSRDLFEMEIIDLTGKVVKNEKISPNGLVQLPFQHFANGIYLVNIFNTNTQRSISYKLVKTE